MFKTIVKIFNRKKTEDEVLTIPYHHDAGHGWYEVTHRLVTGLNFHKKISKYSYISLDKKVIFLEEDVDAGVLFAALHKVKIKYKIFDVDNGQYSFIRSLLGYDHTQL